MVAIDPTSDVLPENLLRLYVEFSKPMKTVGNLEAIRIYDAKGDAVSGVLFNNVVELWDPAQTQLTLIFDPARVKTGLQAHEALGRALMPGETYRLVITKGEDVDGRELEAPFTKAFRVVAQDVTAPDMAAWSVALPPKATRAALEIRFPAQIDRMSLLTRLRPLDSAGRPVPGSIRIGEGETLWAFTPSRPWQPGDYAISVNTRLADPSGNNFNGLFDHKWGSLNGPEGQTRSLPFVIK